MATYYNTKCSYKTVLCLYFLILFNWSLPLSAPSQAPTSFSVTPLNSTSIKASWQLPTIDSVSGIITGFKLLYRNKISAADPLTVITIGSKTTLTQDITGLEKFTEYEFQILAILPPGNGAQSAVKTVRTTEDGKAH